MFLSIIIVSNYTKISNMTFTLYSCFIIIMSESSNFEQLDLKMSVYIINLIENKRRNINEKQTDCFHST